MVILIDYENVSETGFIGWENLKKEDIIYVFYSNEVYNTLQNGLMKRIQKNGIQVMQIKLLHKGRNALDFYIASKVAEIVADNDKEEICIISKDKGFNAVKDYWYSISNIQKDIRISMNINDIFAQLRHNKVNQKRKISIFKSDTVIRKISLLLHLKIREQLSISLWEIYSSISNVETMKDVYLNCIKKFGMRKGVWLYKEIKEFIENKEYIKKDTQEVYFAVLIGREPGIYLNYEEYDRQMKKYSNSEGNSFRSLDETVKYYEKNGIYEPLEKQLCNLGEGEAIASFSSINKKKSKAYYALIIADRNGIIYKLKNKNMIKKAYMNYTSIIGDAMAIKVIVKLAIKENYKKISIYLNNPDILTLNRNKKNCNIVEKNMNSFFESIEHLIDCNFILNTNNYSVICRISDKMLKTMIN